MGRLRQTTSGGTTTVFLYEGDRLIGEYNGSTLLRRYAHGPGVDEPIVWYEGSGLTDKRWLHPDERGSIVAWSNASAGATVYRYGAFGEPAGNDFSGSRFRYTGQIALPEVKLYHYKARVYDPAFGRFLQTDPVGYDDDFNLYAYTRNDPLNNFDSTGNGLVPTVVKFIAKGGDFAATFAGAIDDAKTIVNPAVPLPGRIAAAVSLASEISPVSLRDVKAGTEIVQKLGKGNSGVPDNALIVRGGGKGPNGGNSPEGIQANIDRSAALGISGFSANSVPGATSVAEVCSKCSNLTGRSEVGVMTAGDVRGAGGEVAKQGDNPFHVNVSGLDAATASELLKVMPNPAKKP